MGEFELFFVLGYRHVLDVSAYDHVLFLSAMALVYSFGQWSRLLGLVSLFTIGHTFSILASYYDLINPPLQIIEILIPVTIILTALSNIYKGLYSKDKEYSILIFAITLVFGLIHGFGFGRYFIQIAGEASFNGFLAFALGIEGAQILIVLSILVLNYSRENLISLSRKDWLILTSGIIIGITLPMLLDRI